MSQAAASDDAVQVWVKTQVTRPGMQHCRQAQLSAEATLVSTQRQEGLAAGREQRVEENIRVAHRNAIQQVIWHCEDDVEVFGVQQARHSARDPAGLRQ